MFRKTKTFIRDRSGSETVEKMGWILGAAILVAIAVMVMNKNSPDTFKAIITQATNSVQMTP